MGLDTESVVLNLTGVSFCQERMTNITGARDIYIYIYIYTHIYIYILYCIYCSTHSIIVVYIIAYVCVYTIHKVCTKYVISGDSPVAQQ